MSKSYIVNCYTCQHNGQETCKGCNTLLNGEDEPYENWQLREDLETKDQRIAELEEQLKNTRKETAKKVIDRVEELSVFDFKAYEEHDLRKYTITELALDVILREYGE